MTTTTYQVDPRNLIPGEWYQITYKYRVHSMKPVPSGSGHGTILVSQRIEPEIKTQVKQYRFFKESRLHSSGDQVVFEDGSAAVIGDILAIDVAPMVDQPQPAPALSPALTDAESVANAEQHARSIPHAIEATLAPVSITEEILTATDSYLTLATNIDDIAAIYEAQDGLAEIVEDAKPLKPRTPHDLAIGVWHSMQASTDLLAPHGALIRYCKVHDLEYRDVRAQLVYDVSKNNPAGYTRKEHNLTEHEVKEFIRAVDQFTSQAPVKVQG